MSRNYKVSVLYTKDSEIGKELMYGSYRPCTIKDFREGYIRAFYFVYSDCHIEATPEEFAEHHFMKLQGEFMKPALQDHIKNLFEANIGMTHTSMSVGDVVVVEREENGEISKTVLLCAGIGFEDITNEIDADALLSLNAPKLN